MQIVMRKLNNHFGSGRCYCGSCTWVAVNAVIDTAAHEYINSTNGIHYRMRACVCARVRVNVFSRFETYQ